MRWWRVFALAVRRRRRRARGCMWCVCNPLSEVCRRKVDCKQTHLSTYSSFTLVLIFLPRAFLCFAPYTRTEAHDQRSCFVVQEVKDLVHGAAAHYGVLAARRGHRAQGHMPRNRPVHGQELACSSACSLRHLCRAPARLLGVCPAAWVKWVGRARAVCVISLFEIFEERRSTFFASGQRQRHSTSAAPQGSGAGPNPRAVQPFSCLGTGTSSHRRHTRHLSHMAAKCGRPRPAIIPRLALSARARRRSPHAAARIQPCVAAAAVAAAVASRRR